MWQLSATVARCLSADDSPSRVPVLDGRVLYIYSLDNKCYSNLSLYIPKYEYNLVHLNGDNTER